MLNHVSAAIIPPAGYLMLLIVLMYMLPQKKRPGFLCRFLLCVTGMLAVAVCREMIHLHFRNLASVFYENGQTVKEILVTLAGEGGHLITGVAVLSLFFYFCISVSRPDAVVLSICSYLTMDLYLSFFFFLEAGGKKWMPVDEIIILIIVYTVLFCCMQYFLFAVRIIRNRTIRAHDDLFIILMACMLMLNHGVFSYHIVKYGDVALNGVMCCIAGGSFVILLAQIIRESKNGWWDKAEMERQLRLQKQKDYENMRLVSENMRHHFHDLKYLLAALERNPEELHSGALDTLREDIAVFENTMDTGCDTLDVVLSDALQRCRQRGVQWTCMADGAALGFVDPLDLYIMVGNALDNALESLSAVSDPGKRFLSVNIWSRERMVFLRIENYCETVPEFRNEFPVTTKQDAAKHGFGMRSIDSVVARYGGEWKAAVEENTFILRIILPMPVHRKLNK